MHDGTLSRPHCLWRKLGRKSFFIGSVTFNNQYLVEGKKNLHCCFMIAAKIKLSKLNLLL